MYASFINSQENSYIEIKDWKGSYWLSFWAGMLYNLVFIVYVPLFAAKRAFIEQLIKLEITEYIKLYFSLDG